MRGLWLLPAIAATCGAQAQQIDGYRYWFDDDAASAVTTTVGATDELTLSTTWPTGSMAPGYHRVSFQFRDTNGEWSVPGTRQFVRSARDIIGYRYWVNDDIGTLTTGSVGPAQTADLNALIDPGTLTRDYNTVTIQFRDADSEWSVPKTSVFVLNSGLVNGYQYWIDDDIANSQSGSIGPAGVVDLIADLPTGVPNGNHLFTIRFSAANGSWSVPLTAEFSVILSTPELPGITDLLLFPNPATDQLGLRLTTDQARTLQLEVLDLSGAVVADLSSWSVSTTAHRSWDISALASGSYLLRITGEHGAWTTRFVKP